MSTPDAFAQLALTFTDPLQHEYEIIRPVVLFAETVAERSQQTSVERTQVGAQARRFVQHGMLGLTGGRAGQSGRKPHVYPDPIAAYLIYVKQLYPAIHHHELARIVRRKFGYTTNHRTRPADHPANQLSLPFLTEVLAAQHLDRRAGRVRLHGILEQRAAEAGAPNRPTE